MVNKLKSKVGFILGGMVVIAVLGLFLCYYYLAPNSYLAIDVNPSIEFKTNRLNQVVSINPVNDDAKNLLAGYELKDKHIEKVIQDIVDRMVLTGYLTPEKDNMILITVEDKNTSLNLLNNVKEDLVNTLSDRKLEVEVMEQSIDITADDIQEAHNNNISAGKLAIINKIMKFDKSITVEELSEVSILDMIAYANLYNIELDDLLDDFDDVEDYVFEDNFDKEDTLKQDSTHKGDSLKISEGKLKDSKYVRDVSIDSEDDSDEESYNDNQDEDYEYDDDQDKDYDDDDDDDRSDAKYHDHNKIKDVNDYKDIKDRADITDKEEDDVYEDTDDNEDEDDKDVKDDKDDEDDEDNKDDEGDSDEYGDSAAKQGENKDSNHIVDQDDDDERDDEEEQEDDQDHDDDDDGDEKEED